MLKIIKRINVFLENLGESHAFSICLSNAKKGMPNSQLHAAAKLALSHMNEASELTNNYKKYHLPKRYQ